MPTPTKYTYSIAADLPEGVVNTAKLHAEISSSSIVTALDRIDQSSDVLDIWFKDSLSTAGKTTLDGDVVGPAGGLLADHDSSPSAQPPDAVVLAHQTTSDNRLRVAIEKSDELSKDIYTHNWCMPTTWYQGSIRVVNEVATNTGNQLTYTLAHQNVIDTYHGKITGEDDLLDSNGNSYRVVVKVNSVTKTEQDPHYGTGGDFTVNYTVGSITFLNALQPSDVIEVTHHYAQGSAFYIRPDAGTTLSLDISEVQFSVDVGITDTVIFQTFGYVDVFAPQLLNNPYPPGTKIPIKTFKYKTISDYQNAAFKAYPTYPAIGGNTWRGQTQEVVVFDWDYQRGLSLHSAYGMEVVIYLEHHTPFAGTYATATVYCGVV
jgi:hypothetical protein